jgi:hypothetical protein
VIVELVPFEYQLAIAPSTQTVVQGQGLSYTVAVTGTAGEPEAVTLALGGLPAGISGGVEPPAVVPTGTALLTVTTALDAPLGDHTLVISGSTSSQVQTATATLSVTPHPDFELGVWPDYAEMMQGEEVSYTVQVTALHGFDQPVTLSLAGGPPSMAVTWGENPLPAGGSTMLTVAPVPDTPAGTWPVTVTGTSADLSHSAVVTLEVTPRPDFALGARPTMQTVSQGESVTYTVLLTAEHGFGQAVALEVSGLPSGATAEWATSLVTPSASTILTVTTTPDTPPGEHKLPVTASGGGVSHQVGLLLVVSIPSRPNLTIKGMQIDPAVPAAGQPFELLVSVLNSGTADAADEFLVDWYADPAQPPTAADAGQVAWLQPGLDAASDIALTGQYTFTAPGRHTLYAQVDRGGAIAESDEADNLHGPLTVTVSATPQPDLAIPWMSYLSPTPTVGLPATLIVEVRNQGTLSTTTDVRVDLYVDPAAAPGPGEAGDLTHTTAPLDPGQVVELELPYTFTTPGPHLVYAQVDALGAIEEGIEDNNLGGPLTVTVRAPQPDLVVEGITFEPAVPLIGEVVTATVMVRNQGDAEAGPFRADWYVDPGEPPYAGQVGDGYWEVPGLAVSAAVDLSVAHSFGTAGSHWLYAQADTLDAVAEGVEKNNVGSGWLPVVEGTEEVCGAISSDATWRAGTLYRVTCDVTVNAGVTLTVEAGAVVRFSSGTGLSVQGTLLARGTATQPIPFLANSETPSRGYWDGIDVLAGGRVALEQAIVSHAGSTSGNYDAALYNVAGTLEVTATRVISSAYYGIYSAGPVL